MMEDEVCWHEVECDVVQESCFGCSTGCKRCRVEMLATGSTSYRVCIVKFIIGRKSRKWRNRNYQNCAWANVKSLKVEHSGNDQENCLCRLLCCYSLYDHENQCVTMEVTVARCSLHSAMLAKHMKIRNPEIWNHDGGTNTNRIFVFTNSEGKYFAVKNQRYPNTKFNRW